MTSVFDDPAALERLRHPPADPEQEYGSVFPFRWYEAFLDALAERDVVTITYRDLFEGCDDREWDNGYPHEHARWKAQRDPDRIYLLIQHDIDFVPEFTVRMVALEAARGIRSSIFMFHERAGNAPADSPYDDRPYVVDHDFFREAQDRGFVIGYHQNALALTEGPMEQAVRRFEQDVAHLDRHYRVEYFCPHGGGGRAIDGAMKHNFDVPVPAALRDRLRWVYNRYGMRFAARYSDGGLRRLVDPDRLARLDILGEFVNKMQPGRRYFALVHPQLWGYNINRAYNPRLLEQPWYRAVLERYAPSRRDAASH
jgi:hypothetical protein